MLQLPVSLSSLNIQTMSPFCTTGLYLDGQVSSPSAIGERVLSFNLNLRWRQMRCLDFQNLNAGSLLHCRLHLLKLRVRKGDRLAHK